MTTAAKLAAGSTPVHYRKRQPVASNARALERGFMLLTEYSTVESAHQAILRAKRELTVAVCVAVRGKLHGSLDWLLRDARRLAACRAPMALEDALLIKAAKDAGEDVTLARVIADPDNAELGLLLERQLVAEISAAEDLVTALRARHGRDA